MVNFEKCTVAMLGGPCSQHVTGNTSRKNQPQSAIMSGTGFLVAHQLYIGNVMRKYQINLGMKSWDLHMCDRASTITHIDRVKKSNPWYNKIWLCLNVTISSSQICLSVIFIHFVIISKYLGKNCTYIHTFFNHTSLLQLIFGRLQKHASPLAIQSKDNSKTLEWQVFSQGWWGLDLPIWYLRITFPMYSYSWCATRNPVPDSTYHLVDLTSVTTESRNVSPCMTATPWSRVNWKMCDENSTFGCFDAICTQSVSHDHTVVPFMTFWQF